MLLLLKISLSAFPLIIIYNKIMYKINNPEFFISLDSALSFRPAVWAVEDRQEDPGRTKRLKNHIKANDYFGTLASVLDLLRQVAEKEKNMPTDPENIRLLKDLKSDLTFLQKNYKIIKKKKHH